MAKPYFILTVDGGGFRGLFAAHLLDRIEQGLPVPLVEQFDMFAGTSTGAIIAAGLASGKRAHRLRQLYTTRAARVFRRRLRLFRTGGLLASRYSSEALRGLLEDEFGDLLLGEIEKPLLIPAVDIGEGCVHVLKSGYSEDFRRDRDVRVADAVLASCAAPTYFDPHAVGPYNLADGGLWANNPAVFAVVEAYRRMQVPLDNVRVLSIGTGTARAFYPRSTGAFRDRLSARLGWGLATRWHGQKLIDLILNLQSESAHNVLTLLLRDASPGVPQVLRLTFDSDSPLPMDAPRKADDWIAKADFVFSRNAQRVLEFLNPGGNR